MADLVLIANPAASGFTGGLHRDVMRILSAAHRLEAVWPTTPNQVEDLAGRAVAEHADLVVAFGGDGVVHHVACALAGSGVALGIVPAGTTNVFARILGLPIRPKAAARYLVSDRDLISVPLARIEASGFGHHIDSYATFAVGLGLDAEVVAIAEKEPYRKYRFGSIHYARTAGGVIIRDFRRRPANLRVSDGTRQLDAISVLVQVHQPYTYFGRVPLSITSAAPQGLDALLIERLGIGRIPSILRRATTGADLGRVRGLTVWEGREEIHAYAEPRASLQADGELLGLVHEARISAASDRLWVAAPRKAGRG